MLALCLDHTHSQDCRLLDNTLVLKRICHVSFFIEIYNGVIGMYYLVDTIK